jgi:hypothetical protein
MKKILIFIICFLSFSIHTEAFLWEDLWFNLYNSIDEWFEELEISQYEYELSWQWKTIRENINNILANEWIWECIEGEITSSDVTKIFNWEINILVENLKEWENCKSENWEITNDILLKISKVIEELKIESEKRADEKSEKINRISRIWIYSDGNIKNWPFDLIKDLQDIDQIIFASKINYEWEELLSDDDLLNCITGKEKCFKKADDIASLQPEEPEIITNLKERIKNDWTEKEEKEKWETIESELEDNYLCVDDVSAHSWLNPEALENIINDIKNWENNKNNLSAPKEENKWSVNSNTQDGEERKFSMSTYKKVNDPWPCYDFFCITIEFITYQHKLLIWGENISIEYLINRSNKHLKKFASTSLIPAKMSTNNFELGIKDMILEKLFHMGFIITKKPVPILDIQKPWENSSNNPLNKYSKKKLLEAYYKNIWLEYSRRNDLSILDQEEWEKKSVLDTWELTIASSTKKTQNYAQVLEEQSKKNDILQAQIEQEAHNKELKDFEEQFIELQGFSQSINEYVNSLDSYIKGMLKIPQK